MKVKKVKNVLLPFIAGALAISLAACGNGEDNEKSVEQQVEPNEIVAIVNEEELKGDEFNNISMSIQDQMEQMGEDTSSKESAEQVKIETLDILVNQALIRQQTKESKMKAEKSEVDEGYTELVKQVGDEKEMKKMLKSKGMDVETLKEQIAESIVFEKYGEKVAPVGKITEEEIKEYYDQVSAESKDAGQELPPLEEVREEIKGSIEQEQQQKKLAAHVEELKENAEIELKI